MKVQCITRIHTLFCTTHLSFKCETVCVDNFISFRFVDDTMLLFSGSCSINTDLFSKVFPNLCMLELFVLLMTQCPWNRTQHTLNNNTTSLTEGTYCSCLALYSIISRLVLKEKKTFKWIPRTNPFAVTGTIPFTNISKKNLHVVLSQPVCVHVWFITPVLIALEIVKQSHNTLPSILDYVSSSWYILKMQIYTSKSTFVGKSLCLTLYTCVCLLG